MATTSLSRHLRKVWEKFLPYFRTSDTRLLQQELDIRKLALLTSYKRFKKSRGEINVEELSSIVEQMSFMEQQKEVQDNVHMQVLHVAKILDDILVPEEVRKSVVEPKKSRPSGLSFAVSEQTQRSPGKNRQIVKTLPLTKDEVSDMLRGQLGYTLQLNSSSISHEEAGDGLFLSGKAEAGTVISVYPGVIYSPSQYRYIPGYPKVDRGNPYLVSRYDGIIIDAKPWGKGGENREWWDGNGNVDDYDPSTKSIGLHWWQVLESRERKKTPIAGEIIERRNPLSLAHFANHPPQGVQPNVMLCPYTFPEMGESVFRPYIPNVVLRSDTEEEMRRDGILWVKKGKEDASNDVGLRTVLLVATRAISNEEVFLNYRLSNPKERPTWYHSVDEEEDRRRWG